MSTSEKTQEQISAFADGELDDPYIAEVLTALRKEEPKDDWELYHQIGDILRSEDMAVSMSSGFAARMAARLEQEPTIIVPAAATLSEQKMQEYSLKSLRNASKRWAMPGMAVAAAVAAIAFVTTPHIMVAMSKGSATLASAPAAEVSTVSAANAVILRDPDIDDYLLAHQRFSPSLYSTAQYARSATFAADSSK